MSKPRDEVREKRPRFLRGVTTIAVAVALPTLAAACSEEAAPTGPPMTCQFWGTPTQLAERPSVFDSAMAGEGTAVLAKVCYSRPVARGRTVFGELVPYDTLWRTGANEATTLHLAADAEIAGLAVDSGAYTLYTVPSATGWSLVVNGHTGQWGLTQDAVGSDGVQYYNAYTRDVRRREVGRTPIQIEAIDPVDTLTATFENAGEDALHLYFDWEATRVVIPIRWTAAGS